MHKKNCLNLYIMSMDILGRNRYYIHNDTGIVNNEERGNPASYFYHRERYRYRK